MRPSADLHLLYATDINNVELVNERIQEANISRQDKAKLLTAYAEKSHLAFLSEVARMREKYRTLAK